MAVNERFSVYMQDMKDKLDRIGRNKEKLAKIIIREGWINEADYSEEQLNKFTEVIFISNVIFETTPNGICGRFVVSDDQGYLDGDLAFSMAEDNSIDILGWSF